MSYVRTKDSINAFVKGYSILCCGRYTVISRAARNPQSNYVNVLFEGIVDDGDFYWPIKPTPEGGDQSADLPSFSQPENS